MKLNYLGFAVPMFLFFIGLEYYYSKKKGKIFFQYAESVANLNVGIAERLLDVFTTGLFFFVFVYIHEHFAIFNIKAGVFTWILLFLLTDLVWYWYHRLAHEINAFWAVHVCIIKAKILIIPFRPVLQCSRHWCDVCSGRYCH